MGIDWPNPEGTGGIFVDAAIHDYDAARFLIGREVHQISAFGGNLVHSKDAMHGDLDTCFTILTFEDETCALLEWSRYAAYGYDVYSEVVGTDGALRIGSLRHMPLVSLTKQGAAADILPSFQVRFSEAYRDELQAFARSILVGTPVTPNAEDARWALHIALQAKKSFEQGRTIQVPSLSLLR
jgi:predicted dehydrogenase